MKCESSRLGSNQWGHAMHQWSVLGADILNNPRNNYYGRSSNYSQRIQLSQKTPVG